MNLSTIRRAMAPALLAALLVAASPLPAKPGMKGGGAGMLRHLKKSLDLTDAQVEKFKALNKADGEANQALRDKVAADVANLKVLINKKAPDGELSALISTLKADHKAMQEAEHKHMEAQQQILTPTQQAKAVIQMAEMMGGKGGRMRGMRGHGDGDDGDDEHEGKGARGDGDDDDAPQAHDHGAKEDGGKGKKRD